MKELSKERRKLRKLFIYYRGQAGDWSPLRGYVALSRFLHHPKFHDLRAVPRISPRFRTLLRNTPNPDHSDAWAPRNLALFDRQR